MEAFRKFYFATATAAAVVVVVVVVAAAAVGLPLFLARFTKQHEFVLHNFKVFINLIINDKSTNSQSCGASHLPSNGSGFYTSILRLA
jgi:hypothetical protein